MSLQLTVDRALAETPPGRVVWVALSGGLDSSLLLTLAAAAWRRHPRPLYALHVHHGLQAIADGFELHCRRLCSRLGVPFFVERVRVERDAGLGLEGAARQARYAAFARRVMPGETLWLAQHRDDQAETFLLAALRGSGARGLAAMPPTREWRGRHLGRPLLDVSRAELEAEAARRGVRWVDDPSNADERLDRNLLRHRVLPLLEARWPAARASLARSAAHAAETETLLEELADETLVRLGGEPGRLDLAALRALTAPRCRLLVRHCCRRLGLPTPPAARLEALLVQLDARRDAQACVAWPGAEARLWRDALYLLAPLPDLPAGWEAYWEGGSDLSTPLGRWPVRLVREDGAPAALRLAPRGGGERLRLPGRGGRDLKRLMQEWGVPPWQRRQVIVVWNGDDPVAALLPPGRWLGVAAGWRGETVSSGPV
ncbi:tRNA lysidine(34) synthetase TilS [Halomonas sp. MCCC 1A11036]|uniref:tRNA(Ile)-lysidine synthase n=1 Tax=Billgrantia zhangzhouensis TaxID=2733481 RepID=A0ABS9AGI9_9GAMM|nr:tRNA lysidine(34) synthetase TilS [Halomonas zhangzhouensis]MCE8020783.1 tRNA lysidine(34) synthetase TilS [Halomonas zhangzhouensis]